MFILPKCLSDNEQRDEHEDRQDAWDDVRVGYRLPDHEERESSKHLQDPIADPLWVDGELRRLRGGDNMAEGLGEAIDDEELANGDEVVDVKDGDED